MTLAVEYSFDTKYEPLPQESEKARAVILRLVQEQRVTDFFDLVKRARQEGISDDVFDYVFSQLKLERKLRMSDDFQLQVT